MLLSEQELALERLGHNVSGQPLARTDLVCWCRALVELHPIVEEREMYDLGPVPSIVGWRPVVFHNCEAAN